MKYEFTGTIVAVGEVQTLGNKGFRKRTFVVSEHPDAEYPDYLVCELKGGKHDHTNDVTQKDVGSRCTVTFAPDGRRWEDPTSHQVRWFSSNVALKVQIATSDDVPPPPEAPETAALTLQDLDEMPF